MAMAEAVASEKLGGAGSRRRRQTTAAGADTAAPSPSFHADLGAASRRRRGLTRRREPRARERERREQQPPPMWRARRWPWPWRSQRRAARMLSSGEPAAGRRRVAALWGNGDYGRLGMGALESRWSPTACPFFLTGRPGDDDDDPPASLACGGAHTLFLTESGRVFAAGLNDFGQLGIGSSVTHSLEPIEVSGFDEKVVEVSAGNHHSCAVTADGKLFTWGRNSSGQLGLGKRAGKVVSTPRKVDCLADARVKMVALGSEHSIATTEEGEVLSWGAAGAGRLGHGHKTSILGFSITTSEYTPRLIKNLDGVKIKRIAAGMLHSACIDEKGTLFIFGQKTEKVGFGRSGDELRPTVVEEVPFSEEVACGGYHTCVVTDSGDLYSWGSNENGCLGLGGTDMVRSPEVLKSSLFKFPVSKVEIFTRGAGEVLTGHGNDVDYFEPVMVEFGKNARAVHVSCGFNHTGAIFEYSEN
uniref:RCC1-like domain-containing protein n=1 Tax=Oryza meridionalis TaxID=40149 RepID=A0A0E0F6F6_9ORYZ